MASGSFDLDRTSGSSYVEVWIEWSSSSNGSSANSSDVTATMKAKRTNTGYTTYGTGTFKISINGSQESTTKSYSITSSTVTLFEVTKTVAHNNDGTKSITIAGEYSGDSPIGGDGSDYVTLDRIPRYTTITTFNQNSKGLNWIKYNWATADTVDQVQYKIGSGSWVTASTASAKSGTFQINNLNPNTAYSVKIRVRRKDSQLYTESSSLSITTYDIAKITTANNFNLGDNVSITISNPASATATLVMKVGNTQIISKNLNTGANTISLTDSQLDSLYQCFGNSNTITVTYILTTNNNSNWTNTKTVTCTLTGNQKTARIKVSGTWNRAKAWVKVSGTWKRAVVWEKNNDTWKRSI